MAQTRQFKFDATRPFYAAVGVTDLAVEFARTRANDVQARFAKADFEPKALRDQARTVVVSRVEELNKDAKKFPSKFEAYVNKAVADLNDNVVETYEDLAQRGRVLVGRITGQEATRRASAAARGTVTRAKTARTQTSKSARSTAGTAKRSANTSKSAAKRTGSTAKRNAKATTTSAKKAASATGQAASDAAGKVGD
jgi:hypothetical protein